MKLAVVSWEDILVSGGWAKKDEATRPSPCQSVGWVAEKTKEYLLLVGDIDGETATPNCHDDYNRRIAIPMGCVKKIRYLKP